MIVTGHVRITMTTIDTFKLPALEFHITVLHTKDKIFRYTIIIKDTTEELLILVRVYSHDRNSNNNNDRCHQQN